MFKWLCKNEREISKINKELANTSIGQLDVAYDDMYKMDAKILNLNNVVNSLQDIINVCGNDAEKVLAEEIIEEGKKGYEALVEYYDIKKSLSDM